MKAHRVIGAIRITRPLNVGLFFAGVIVGGTLAAGKDALVWPVNRDLILAGIAAALIGAGANAFNDLVDADIDRINRPGRPLPRGQTSALTARVVWLATWVFGIGVAGAVSAAHALVAAVCALLLYLYSSRLKRVLVLGNLTVATVVAVSLLFGGLAMGNPVAALPGAVFAFLTTVAREIVKDAQDQVGDRAAGIDTFPIRFGGRTVVATCGVVLFLTIALTPVPYLTLEYSRLYLVLVLAVNGLLLASAWKLDSRDLQRSAGPASVLLKSAMAAGMVALAAARIGAPYVLTA